jgi:hypothetical protein
VTAGVAREGEKVTAAHLFEIGSSETFTGLLLAIAERRALDDQSRSSCPGIRLRDSRRADPDGGSGHAPLSLPRLAAANAARPVIRTPTTQAGLVRFLRTFTAAVSATQFSIPTSAGLLGVALTRAAGVRSCCARASCNR